ncbi:hypothetical protein [Mycobacteroides abscessus]|uniref:hypothetical protein n=1 Tax=Mycobacteroides abscessus TaxID=36809 RepID=UPI002104E357|nr:hypothetical protein [Mycobacteroides abscessus]
MRFSINLCLLGVYVPHQRGHVFEKLRGTHRGVRMVTNIDHGIALFHVHVLGTPRPYCFLAQCILCCPRIGLLLSRRSLCAQGCCLGFKRFGAERAHLRGNNPLRIGQGSHIRHL